MACRSVLRCVFLTTEPWRPSSSSSSSSPHHHFLLPFASLSSPQTTALYSSRGGFRSSKKTPTPTATTIAVARDCDRRAFVSCSAYDNGTPEGEGEEEQGPPQEAVLKAISEVSKAEGRVGQTTNLVIGGTVADDSTNEWLALDQKVNSYPTVRGFTAIGTGGDDFVQAMVVAVESVIQQPIPEGNVRQKVSSRGKYVSVNIGPVQVVSSEQVQAVYNAMRRDDRMKYFL